MNQAKEIRAAAIQQAEALGINSTVAVGVIEELSQYGTLTRGGRIGVFGAPQGVVPPTEETPRDWQGQLTLGLKTFAALKDAAGIDDIPALVAYIGGPDAPMRALRALERGARYTGEAFDPREMRAALDAMKPQPDPPGVAEAAVASASGPPAHPAAPVRAAPEDRQIEQRMRSAFEEDPEVPDVPPHLSKLIESIVDE